MRKYAPDVFGPYHTALRQYALTCHRRMPDEMKRLRAECRRHEELAKKTYGEILKQRAEGTLTLPDKPYIYKVVCRRVNTKPLQPLPAHRARRRTARHYYIKSTSSHRRDCQRVSSPNMFRDNARKQPRRGIVFRDALGAVFSAHVLLQQTR